MDQGQAKGSAQGVHRIVPLAQAEQFFVYPVFVWILGLSLPQPGSSSAALTRCCFMGRFVEISKI
jgi:hypothetical protein